MNEGPTRVDVITGRERTLVALWALALVLLYAVSTYFGARQLHAYKVETERARRAFLESATIDRAHAPEESVVEKAAEVTVGIYVNNIGDISPRDGSWTEDFDLWFRWKDPTIDPGASFQVINGEVLSREKLDVDAAGAEQYARYRVRARFTKSFDPGRFPFGDEALTIQIEDSVHGVDRVRYVADEANSGVSSRGVPRSLAVTRSLNTVKYFVHDSTLGDPRATPQRTHSLLVSAMLVSPPSAPLFLKNFQALFASIAVAFIVFFVRPIHVDPRFGLAVGAIFTTTANNIMVATVIPVTGRFTLTAMVNAAGLATIFLVLVESAISLYLLDSLGRERLYRLLDRVTFVTLLLGYVSLNVLLASAAQ